MVYFVIVVSIWMLIIFFSVLFSIWFMYICCFLREWFYPFEVLKEKVFEIRIVRPRCIAFPWMFFTSEYSVPFLYEFQILLYFLYTNFKNIVENYCNSRIIAVETRQFFRIEFSSFISFLNLLLYIEFENHTFWY